MVILVFNSEFKTIMIIIKNNKTLSDAANIWSSMYR